ncbi:MAG: PepSY-associated TM helix domain-containing protein [Methylococcales bacterium]
MRTDELIRTNPERPADVDAARLGRLKARRKIWLKVHCWLGLVLGFFLSIFGLTGSILVFHAEINELLNPALLTVTPPQEGVSFRPLSELVDAGRRLMPANAKHTFATYPRDERTALQLSYALPVAGGGTESWQVAVDPYTAQVIGKRLMNTSESLFPKPFIGFVFVLHYALLLKGDLGGVLAGILGTLLIISVLTGLIVWWPLTGKWRKALTIKHKASAERFNHDLHKTFGFYSAAVLAPVLFSGIYMNLPEHVAPVLELFSPVTYRYWFRSVPIPGQEPITMAEAVAIAASLYPKGRPHWVYGAPGSTDTYTVCLDDVDRPGSMLQRVCVVMDRYTGEVLDLDDPAKSGAGEVFTHWQWPLHSGQAFGMTGRILVCLSGIACPLLFTTGVIRWSQKRRARRRKFHNLPSPTVRAPKHG